MKHYGFGSRILAWLCVVIMLVMMLPLSAAAGDDPAEDGNEPTNYSIAVQHSDGNDQVEVWAEVNGQKVTEAAENAEVTIVVQEDYTLTVTCVGETDGAGSVTVVDNKFTMPAFAVTVTVSTQARQTVAVTFDLTHASTTGATTVYADVDYTAALSADIHYELPETIEVTVRDSELTQEQYTWDNETGKLEIEAVYLTGNVKVTATAVEKPYVEIDETGLTRLSLPADVGKVYPSELGEDASYSVLLVPDNGYAVPDSVAVTCNGSSVAFSYENGTVSIAKNELERLLGESETLIIKITAAGVPIEYDITIDISSVNVESIYKNDKDDDNILDEATTVKDGKKVTFKATIEDEVIVNLRADSQTSVPDSVSMPEGVQHTYTPARDPKERIYCNIATLTFEEGSVTKDLTVNRNEDVQEYAEITFDTYKAGREDDSSIEYNVRDDYSYTFNAESGYQLPTNIDVEIDGTALENVTDVDGATSGYTWDGGTLAILSESLQAAFDAKKPIAVTVKAELLNDNLNLEQFKRDAVDEAGIVTATNWNATAILIEPTGPATKIVVEDKAWDGIIVGTDRDAITSEGKNYLEIDDCKNEKIIYQLSDETVKSADGTLPVSVDTTSPKVTVEGYTTSNYSDANENRYVNGSIAITFKVTETNFDEKKFAFDALPTTGCSPSEWSHDGDEHTITLTITADGANDGVYDEIKLKGTDMANNSGEVTADPIVLDKTAPEIVSVAYEETTNSGFVQLAERIWWWIAGKLNPEANANGYSRTVKAVVTIEDELSPVDDYSIAPVDVDVKDVSLGISEQFEGGYRATLTFKVSSQFKEQLKITATDAAGNECAAFEVQTDVDGNGEEQARYSPNLLIDTYAPTITFDEIDYATVHSSNYPVTVTVTDPKMSDVYSGLKQVTVSVHYQQTAAKVDSGSISGYDYSNGVYTKNFYSYNYTQTEKLTVTLPVSLHSNLVYVEVTAVDYAGNTVTKTTKDNGQYIKLDSVTPVVSVVYDNNSAQNSKYFMQSRTATITVTDNNFDASGMTVTTQGTAGAWTATGATNADGQQNVYTCAVSYATDADYTLNVTAVDLGGNTTSDTAVDYSGQTAAQDFTVDLTKPTFSIDMVSGDAEIRSSDYSNQDVTVTLTVNEHNFDSATATAGLTVIHEGVDISQSIRSSLTWSNNGDVRTASFVLTDDGEYEINLSFQDLAGNSTAVASDVVVYVDQTDALVYVTGVADKSANAQKEIAPVVTIWDKYYNGDSVVIRLRNGAGQDVTDKYLDMESGRSEILYDEQRDMYYQTFTFKNFTEDHVYRLEVRHTDLAGNTNTAMTVLNAKGEETVLDMEKEVMRFSVNRNGSTYSADDDTLEILGKYIQSAKNVRILEINVDELNPDSIYITLTHDNITRDLAFGDDYTCQVPPEQDGAGWNVYEYVFADSLFADDGVYTISIYSVDAAGNVAQNNTKEKGFEITFVVDKTPPIFVAVNLEAGEIYNEEQHEVTINCSDNIALDSVQVYCLDSTAEKDENGNYIWLSENANGEIEMLCEKVELTAVEGSSGDYTFMLYEGDSAATSKQSVLVVCTDKAGNQNVEQEILDFTVSSSFWIRFYANKPLFYGSIGGISALLILAAILFLTKKRDYEK